MTALVVVVPISSSALEKYIEVAILGQFNAESGQEFGCFLLLQPGFRPVRYCVSLVRTAKGRPGAGARWKRRLANTIEVRSVWVANTVATAA
jgi:hypothetical protein